MEKIPQNEKSAESIDENTFSREKIDSQSGSLRSRALAAVFATAMFGSAEKLHSAEIEPTMNWGEGVQELKREVYTSPHETSIDFILFKNGKQTWEQDTGMTTDTESVKSSNKEARDVTKKEVESGNTVIRTCSAHTHPISAAKSIGVINDQELVEGRTNFLNRGQLSLVSLPPSIGDISAHLIGSSQWRVTDMYAPASDWEESVRAEHTSVVFDPQGAWFYKYDEEIESKKYTEALNNFGEHVSIATQAISAKLKDIASNDFRNLIEVLSKKSPGSNDHKADSQIYKRIETAILINHDTDIINIIFPSSTERGMFDEFIKAQEEYSKYENDVSSAKEEYRHALLNGILSQENTDRLSKAYTPFGIQVRFTPYDKLKEEPPCAGVDYKREE